MNPHASEKGRDFNEMSAWRQQEYESKAIQGLSVYADIPVILQVAGVLAALAHPSHIVIYAPGDSLSCRLPATRII
ncbi:hypothetical protein CIG53_00930 [Enterobacter asburiae]|nr:hypothetical protein CIG53_00930 [Enterobacter asburiae]